MSRWIPMFLRALRLAEESDPVLVVRVTGGRIVASVRAQHFWLVGLGVQGLRGMLSHGHDRGEVIGFSSLPTSEIPCMRGDNWEYERRHWKSELRNLKVRKFHHFDKRLAFGGKWLPL